MAKINLKLKRSHFSMPYFFIAAVFVVIPLVILIVYAMRDSKTGAITLKNFIEFFKNKNTVLVMGKSFYIAFLTTVICLLISYPVAMILANPKFNKSAVLVLLFVLPMWINSIMRIYAVKSVFDLLNVPKVGAAAYVRIVGAMVYDFLPFMLLPIYTILANMDKSYLEAATDLGGSPLKAFLKVTLPLSVPAIVSGVLMVFMPSISMFAIVDIVAPEAGVYLFGNLINNYFDKGLYNAGSAYAFILLAIIALTMFVANKLSGGKVQPQAKGGSSVI